MAGGRAPERGLLDLGVGEDGDDALLRVDRVPQLGAQGLLAAANALAVERVEAARVGGDDGSQRRRLAVEVVELALQGRAPADGHGHGGHEGGGNGELQDGEAAARAARALGGAQHARAERRVGVPQRDVERDQVHDLVVGGQLFGRAGVVADQRFDRARLGTAERAESVGGEQLFALLGPHALSWLGWPSPAGGSRCGSGRMSWSAMRSLLMASLTRVLTVPSGVDVSAAISVCVRPAK